MWLPALLYLYYITAQGEVEIILNGGGIGVIVQGSNIQPVWPYLNIKAAFLNVRRLAEVFKTVVVHGQLFPLPATGLDVTIWI